MRDEILQTLLVRDAMASQPNSSAMRMAAIYILHWLRIWASVRSVSSFGPGEELHPAAVQPLADRACFLIRDGAHGGDQSGLAHPLLEDAGCVQKIVVDDGVHHAHAAFVEDAEDGLAALENLGEGDAKLTFGGGQFGYVERVNVAQVVVDPALANPLAQAVDEEGVGEVLAPEGAVLDARLAHAAVDVEHSHEAGPLAGPIGDGEDGAAMAEQAGEDVVAVLQTDSTIDEGEVGSMRSKTSIPMRWLKMKPCLRSSR